MSVALGSAVITVPTVGISVNIIPIVGNYAIQNLQVMVTGALPTATGTYEFQGQFLSGGNIVSYVDFGGTAATAAIWIPLNLSYTRTFNKPLDSLILTPNSTLIFTNLASTNLTGMAIAINVYGFKQ